MRSSVFWPANAGDMDVLTVLLVAALPVHCLIVLALAVVLRSVVAVVAPCMPMDTRVFFTPPCRGDDIHVCFSVDLSLTCVPPSSLFHFFVSLRLHSSGLASVLLGSALVIASYPT